MALHELIDVTGRGAIEVVLTFAATSSNTTRSFPGKRLWRTSRSVSTCGHPAATEIVVEITEVYDASRGPNAGKLTAIA